MHDLNSFVTLTYSDKSVPLLQKPTGEVVGNLQPKDLQDWLKRIRKAIAPSRLRFYAVGEYGDETQRPHYHAALFGYPSCGSTQTQFRNGLLRCCRSCHLVHETWGHGNIYLGTLETSSAQYVAGYVTKKMTARDDPRLDGREPEFARMSLRPGIGYDAMHEVASTLMQFNLDKPGVDVPSTLAHGKRQLPLGRYLRRSLRTMIGREVQAPDAPISEQEKEMLALLEAAKHDSENPSLKAQLLKANEQKIRSMKARAKLYEKGKKL